ncbi:THAP domain-containing protein [Ooceraea biroi]|uniref:THAP domain-containing protein n=1 Tax=Ooceraea biroi TaxID=2015173 RepID=A0A026VZG7_OOCBI|nr:THAP domain-containing protein [Ooceraea biroi]
MLKLIRNALASKRILFDRDGSPIKWEFFEKLLHIQEYNFCHLANKLNRKHVQWFKNKMNVKLAAQTLSNSCAHALEQLLEDGVHEFAECAPTAKFCRMVNNTFDCLNFKSIVANAYKKPLSRDTAENVLNLFTDSIDYFSSITIEMSGKPIIEMKLKTGFLGFIIDMTNLKNLYRDYVETGYLRYILS